MCPLKKLDGTDDGTDFPLSSESNSEADVFLMSFCLSYLMFAAFDEEIPVFRCCLEVLLAMGILQS